VPQSRNGRLRYAAHFRQFFAGVAGPFAFYHRVSQFLARLKNPRNFHPPPWPGQYLTALLAAVGFDHSKRHRDSGSINNPLRPIAHMLPAGFGGAFKDVVFFSNRS